MSDGGEEFRLGDRQRVWGRDSGGDIGAFVSSLIYVARESNDTTGGSQKDMRSDRVNLCATDITALSTCPQKHTHTHISNSGSLVVLVLLVLTQIATILGAFILEKEA